MTTTQNQTDNADLIAYTIASTDSIPEVYYDRERGRCVAEFSPNVDLHQNEVAFHRDQQIQKFLAGKLYFFSRIRTLNPQHAGRP